ncbi:amino acid transporter [Rhodovulum sulfidophilum]|uniref:amino acid transporter n=1 Tax=Rhodovulum sulfidophilum TaxID=35806 RepID=UPI0009514D1A|nr:amino acid transporter [Rhodovulum sulfidophilum]MBL3552578.1 hypothetical protein [Rhodovulum sulfidophilum]OLS46851.1 amino acid transporter [Rhodovulum sulfidophilum]
MTTIRDEQTKLTANYVNGLALALFAVGGLASLFSNAYSEHGLTTQVVLASAVCFVASLLLHLLARLILKGLKS